jgi:thymidylate synthase ThyX
MELRDYQRESIDAVWAALRRGVRAPMISAKIILDSLCATRITTFELVMPKCLVAQLNTHRAFSRNSASSRAIPHSKMRALVAGDGFTPQAWPSHRAGMLGGEPLDGANAVAAQNTWEQARGAALDAHQRLADLGVAKEIANRLLEPFLLTTVVLTATDFDGFFAQRLPGHGAQGEMAQLASAMKTAMDESEPRLIAYGEWHLPYADADVPLASALRQSAARCARVSYKRQGDVKSLQDDITRHDALIEQGHWSPLEHQAMAMRSKIRNKHTRNFTGWAQYRALVDSDDAHLPPVPY